MEQEVGECVWVGQVAAAEEAVGGAERDGQQRGRRGLGRAAQHLRQAVGGADVQRDVGVARGLAHLAQQRDGLVGAAQAVEHYEIARYGTLRRWAEMLGMKDAAKLLDATLKEESATDAALTQLADASANERAVA